MSVYMREFHQVFPGLPKLYHTYCTEHPEYGVCMEEEGAVKSMAAHEALHRQDGEEPDASGWDDRIPEGVEFILWGDFTEPGFARFVELDEEGQRVWATAGRGGGLYTDETLLWDAIGDEDMTFLVRSSDASS